VHAQAGSLATARVQLDPGVFAGPAGDRVRAYLEHLHFATATAAKAMDRVASAIPRVAQAIEEAQHDETRMDDAQTRYDTARRTYDQAAGAVTSAAGDVISAEAGVISASHVLALDPVGGSGAVAAAQGALRGAEGRLRQASQQAAADQRLMNEAERAYQRARHTFEQADERRQRELRNFALLCAEEEAATTMCALPTVPEPGSLTVAADTFIGEVNTVLTLAGIPHLAQVPIRTAVTTVEGPDGLPSGDDFGSRLGLGGDILNVNDPTAPLLDKVESTINGLAIVASPSSAGARVLAAATGAAQTGQALAQSDPCNEPPMTPPSEDPPPPGPPAGRTPSGPHPVSTGDEIIGGLAAVGGFLFGAAKTLSNDAGPIVAAAG